jgi:hypothetical protein
MRGTSIERWMSIKVVRSANQVHVPDLLAIAPGEVVDARRSVQRRNLDGSAQARIVGAYEMVS